MSDYSKSSDEDREHDSESEEEMSDEYRDLNSDGHVSDKNRNVTKNEENISNQAPTPVPNTNGRSSVSNFLLKKVLPCAVLGTTAVIAAPIALSAIGFTAGGIASGSIAAGMMSSAAAASGGGVAVGTTVAILQSAGAAGISAAANAGILTAVATTTAGTVELGSQVQDLVQGKKGDKPNNRPDNYM